MKLVGSVTDLERQSDKKAVLLVNLGSPESPDRSSLRRYLGEFLMDSRVIELPFLARWLLVKGIIVNVRSSKSAKMYEEVWTEEGSPLLLNTQKITDKLEQELGEQWSVKMAMCYGRPSVAEKIYEVHQEGIRNVTVVPLYPQYSSTTSGAVFNITTNALRTLRWVPNIRFAEGYYQSEFYISALVKSIQAHWEKNGRSEKLIFSFHGIPQVMIKKGDPYQAQCEETVAAVIKQLDVVEDDWRLVYQSRLGAQQWLKPYCDQELAKLAKSGIKSVDIVCPGFSADCLETLLEMDVENRQVFLEKGGESYNYIPCLNDGQGTIKALRQLVIDK